MNLKYPITIFYSDDAACYIAMAPDLAGCRALGETPEQVLQEIGNVMEQWLLSAQQTGIKLPSIERKRRIIVNLGKEGKKPKTKRVRLPRPLILDFQTLAEKAKLNTQEK